MDFNYVFRAAFRYYCLSEGLSNPDGRLQLSNFRMEWVPRHKMGCCVNLSDTALKQHQRTATHVAYQYGIDHDEMLRVHDKFFDLFEDAFLFSVIHSMIDNKDLIITEKLIAWRMLNL